MNALVAASSGLGRDYRMLRWYLVHTKRSSEALAAAHLNRQGYEVYLPRLAQMVRSSGRWRRRILDELRAREEPGSGLHRLVRAAEFVAGAPVRVTAGVLDGLEGIFQREVGADRVVVLLNLLGQRAAVRIPLDAIEAQHAR